MFYPKYALFDNELWTFPIVFARLYNSFASYNLTE